MKLADTQHQLCPGGESNPFVTSARGALHGMMGCVIGEVAGLMMGVILGLSVWPTIILVTSLAYLSAFTIGLMEIAMNAVDYLSRRHV